VRPAPFPRRDSYPSKNSPRQQPYRVTAAVALLPLPLASHATSRPTSSRDRSPARLPCSVRIARAPPEHCALDAFLAGLVLPALAGPVHLSHQDEPGSRSRAPPKRLAVPSPAAEATRSGCLHPGPPERLGLWPVVPPPTEVGRARADHPPAEARGVQEGKPSRLWFAPDPHTTEVGACRRLRTVCGVRRRLGACSRA
jgi:hypothetical protein